MVAVAPVFSHVRQANNADREHLRQWALADAVTHRSSLESAADGNVGSTTWMLIAAGGAPAAVAVTRFHLFNFVYRPLNGIEGAGRVVAATTIDRIFSHDAAIGFVEAGPPISNHGHELLVGLSFEYEEVGGHEDNLAPVARVRRNAWAAQRPDLVGEHAIVPVGDQTQP